MGTPQCRPGGHSPIKPRRPVRRARRAAKHSTSHTNVGTVMENQPAGRSPKHDTEPLWAAIPVLVSGFVWPADGTRHQPEEHESGHRADYRPE